MCGHGAEDGGWLNKHPVMSKTQQKMLNDW